MSKTRKFFVTYWSPRELLWNEKTMKYACKCDDHCSEEHGGKWHGHAFFYYKTTRTWKEIKEYYGEDCHVEIPKSNSAVIKYILGKGEHAESKSNIVEMGTMPCDNGRHMTFREAVNMTNEEIDELPRLDALAVIKCQEKAAERKKVKLSEWHKDVKVTFITGPSGVGKSLKAKEILENEGVEEVSIVKYESTFYHGATDGKGAAIYDDFRDSHMKASEFINFIDYNTHKMNVKGGSITNNFNRIIITSVQKPEEIYKNMSDEPRQQWMRRIEVIDMWPEESDLNKEFC